MSRKKRERSLTGIYHWIVRGMNRKKLFHKSVDYEFFFELLYEYQIKFDLKIYHYCFMTNHVHLLIHAEELKWLSKFSHFTQRRFAYYYCKKYRWNGSVFRQGYRSLPVKEEAHLLECGRYIERNPIKAKVVQDLKDYSHSSFRFYAYGEPNKLLTESPAFLALSNSKRLRRKIYAKRVLENRIQEEIMEEGLLPTKL